LQCAEHRPFSQGRDALRAAIARQSLTRLNSGYNTPELSKIIRIAVQLTASIALWAKPPKESAQTLLPIHSSTPTPPASTQPEEDITPNPAALSVPTTVQKGLSLWKTAQTNTIQARVSAAIIL